MSLHAYLIALDADRIPAPRAIYVLCNSCFARPRGSRATCARSARRRPRRRHAPAFRMATQVHTRHGGKSVTALLGWVQGWIKRHVVADDPRPEPTPKLYRIGNELGWVREMVCATDDDLTDHLLPLLADSGEWLLAREREAKRRAA